MPQNLEATVATLAATNAQVAKQLAEPLSAVMARLANPSISDELPSAVIESVHAARPDAAANTAREVRVSGIRGTKVARRMTHNIGVALANLA